MENPMKLYAIYIGGSTATSLIELHDVRFVLAETLEDTVPELKRTWWGTSESLHMDCWGELVSADGHDIHLKATPYTGADKVWFVNLGGYDPADFTELHKNVFVVAPTESKAKVRALRQILDWKSHHKDYIQDIEKLTCLSDIALNKGLYIHLEKTDAPRQFTFQYGYNPLNKKAMQEAACSDAESSGG
jgi:hypothetical protein